MKLIRSLCDYIHYNVDELKLKLAIYMAQKAHSQNGKRYFVMPDERDRLIIMHRPSFRKLKHSGRISYAAKINDLKRESFYFTPYSNEIKTKNDHSTYCDSKDNTFFCTIESESITPDIQEAKRIMFHKYMKESRIRKKNTYHTPFLIRLKIRLKLLAIQYKIATR
ncbi:hypothetical protein [Bacteroides sp.]|uniref:hypothetical protein n=1 Tax=Bacteroides sp. TaxID=29523 RepID=UPI00260A5EC7|nr:hypothetical protein [Bacteroides sp.]MDD3037156.1 hypothetical protein [Bacteroides sp.]